MDGTESKVGVTPQSLVNEEDVRETLLADKGNEAKLISYEVINFTMTGDNYASVVSSVQVKYNIHGQEEMVSYVVKLNPCRNFESLEEMTNVIFVKEARFYFDILPELNQVLKEAKQEPLKFPRCFHCNLKNGKEQIYFEDLRVREFQMFDRRKGMDIPHATFVLKELAKLHAAAYLLQAKNKDLPLEQKFDFLVKDFLNMSEDEKNNEELMKMFAGYLTTASNMLQKVGGYERTVTWIDSLKPKLDVILREGMQSETFGTINHGDCWNNNILFKYDEGGKPTDITLLDLQICRKASLACDLNYFLYTSLTGTVRKPNLKEFMHIYHSAYKCVLEAEGLEMYFSEEDLMKEFRDKNILGAIFGMMIIPFLLIEPEQVPDLSGKESDIEKVMEEMKSTAMEMLDTNPLLKPRFLAIFDEMIETGLIP